MSRWDAAARSVPPPLDPRQRQVVEKLAEFRARNGEAFVDVSEDVATAHCEAEQAAVQAELDALDERVGAMEARQKELKGVLYGRFGSQINLEE